MASGKNKRQAELDRQAAEAQKQAAAAQQQFNSILVKQQEPTESQKELDKQNLATLQYKGDYSGLPGTSWATGQLAMLKDEAARQNRGAYTMGAQYADPNLLAAQGEQEAARAAQQDQLGFESAVESRLAGARGEGMNLAGLTQSRLGTALGAAGGMYGTAAGMGLGYQQAANQFASQPGFWSQALLGAIGAGGQALGGRLSATILKSDFEFWYTDSKGINHYFWNWNEKANAIGLRGSSFGVIAEEIETVYPDVVSIHSSGYKQVDYRALEGK